MPRIYLSPSTQDWNPYVDGSGSEEYWMNLLADTLEPYLYANTISFVRNTPEMTAASSIAQANSLGGFDFYLALHSNASGEEQPPKLPWEAICAHEASILPARTSRFPYIWSIRTSSSCFLWMSSLA